MSKENKEEIIEKRKHSRRNVSLWAEEHSLNSRYFHLITNMSLSGLFFQKELPFPIGDTVCLELELPGNSEKLPVQGLIMENYRDSEYKGTGIKFTKFGDTVKDAIEKFLTESSYPEPVNDNLGLRNSEKIISTIFLVFWSIFCVAPKATYKQYATFGAP